MLEKAEDFEGRFREIVSDPLNLLIQRVPEAGFLKDGCVCLHNGLTVPVAGRYSYYEDFSNILVINRGVHEPLEEFVFQEMLKRLPAVPVMLELGAYWGHYSMWLKKKYPMATVILVEPSGANLEAGRQNFLRNDFEGDFIQAFVGKGQFCVDKFLVERGIASLNILHADIQGFEVEMLEECKLALGEDRVDFLFVSTHSQKLHQESRRLIESYGYRVEISSDYDFETTSCDGFIFASSKRCPRLFNKFLPWGRLKIASAKPRELLGYIADVARENQLVEDSDGIVKIPKQPKEIELVYLVIQSASNPNDPLSGNFAEIHQRFVDSYKKFRPTIPHKLTVVCCNGEKDVAIERMFDGLECSFSYYNGGGWDIGAYQAIGQTRDCELLVCCNSQVHFWRVGWLERIVGAFERHGPGVYSPMASFEASPHLRTSCIAFSPKIMRAYPHLIDSRAKACHFEHADWNFSDWAEQQGHPVMMVTWDGEYRRESWRQPPNIFRRGEQSNCLVWDRHTKLYAEADPVQKTRLEKQANGEKNMDSKISKINLSNTCQVINLKEIYMRYFQRVDTGTFVEVGAFDGETYSNTSCLADVGWKGVYIEPVREFAERCLLRHQNNAVKVYNYAASDLEGDLEIEISDAFTTASQSTKTAYNNSPGTEHLQFVRRKIQAVRLDRLLSDANVSPGFELLVVDVEGFEESVFRSFDLGGWLPKMIIVELCDIHPDFQNQPELTASAFRVRTLIGSFGYQEVHRDPINTIFVLGNYPHST